MGEVFGTPLGPETPRHLKSGHQPQGQGVRARPGAAVPRAGCGKSAHCYTGTAGGQPERVPILGNPDMRIAGRNCPLVLAPEPTSGWPTIRSQSSGKLLERGLWPVTLLPRQLHSRLFRPSPHGLTPAIQHALTGRHIESMLLADLRTGALRHIHPCAGSRSGA